MPPTGTLPAPPDHTLTPVIRCADLLTDPLRQTVWREQAGVRTVLPVQGLSLQVWLYLLAQGTRVVRFDELIAQVWAPAIVNEETVTQRVKLLRQALGDSGRQSRYVRSVRGQGYQLCVPPEADASAAAVPAPAAPPVSRTPPRRGLRTLALLLALTGLSAAGWWWLRPVPGSQPAPSPLLARARYYAAIGQQDDNERAIALYTQWLAQPDVADAHTRHTAQVGLSQAWSARVCLYNQPYHWAEQAQALAERVLQEAPQLGLAHAARAYALDCQGQLDPAIEGYAQALAHLPAQAAERLAVQASRAHLLAVRGALALALEENLQVAQAAAAAGSTLRHLELQIARVLDQLGYAPAAEHRYRTQFALVPDNPYIAVAYPRFLFHQGRISEALQVLEVALARPQHPDLHILRGELALVRGDQAGAAQAFADAVALKPENSWPATLHLLYPLPEPSGAGAARVPSRSVLQAQLQQLQNAADVTTGWPENPLAIALLHIALDQPEAALAAVQQAVQQGFRDRAWLQTSALFRPLAQHPQFNAVLDGIARAVASERVAVQRIRGVDALLNPPPTSDPPPPSVPTPAPDPATGS